MILLNGVPPIIGIGLLHVTIINIVAIFIEYSFIKKRHKIDKLIFRTILANLISLVIGLLVLVLIPDYMGGNIMRTDSPMTNFDRISLVAGLSGLFLVNVAIEYPGYIIGYKTNGSLFLGIFKTVLFANLLTNIPVFILYGLLAM
jgi:hypothetical protein